MRLDDIYLAFKGRLHKNASGNVTNVARFNTLLSEANIELFNIKTRHLDLNQTVPETLRNFYTRKGGDAAFAVVENGWLTLPDDFEKLASLFHVYTVKGKPVIRPFGVAFDGELGVVIGSSLFLPTMRNPLAHMQGDRIQILPSIIKRVDLGYYRLPKTPYYDFIISNDREVYLPPGAVHDGTGELPGGSLSRSVELEWRPVVHEEFINLLVSMAAVPIGNQGAYQDAERRKMTGQQ